MNAIDYAIVLARIAKASARTRALLTAAYNVGPTIEVGYKQDMQDWQDKAPLLSFVPNSTEDSAEEGAKNHVWMFAVVNDEEIVEKDGVPVLRAYRVLNELLDIARTEFPREMRGVAPTTFVEEMDVQFRQENYPLMWAAVDIGITENVPVGGRPARR